MNKEKDLQELLAEKVSYPRLKSWACNESCKPMCGGRCQSIR